MLPKYPFRILCLFAIALASTCANAKEPASLTLAEGGRSAYTIALAQDAIPAEKTAAAELQTYLQQATGATLPISPENAVAEGAPQILIGAGARVKGWLPRQKWNALGADGIVIKTHGNSLVLAGGRPRGALYAVYSFLETSVGVRWWAPGETFVPRAAALKIAPQSLVYVPKILTREGFYNSVQADPWFAVRQKNNGQHQQLGAELGGHNTIIGFVHTFDFLLPREKYFAAHPEWYSDPDNGGKPCTAKSKMPDYQRAQPNLTNPELRTELVKNALEWVRKNPEAGMISISQNDNQNPCTSEGDLAVQNREGSPAGPLLEVVNLVAAAVEKEYPDFLVETLAYQYTRKAPRFIRPRRNVVIRLCSIEADFSQPLDSQSNKSFRDDVLSWKKIAPRLYIWNYVTNFGNVILPHPNMRDIGRDIRFFAANNAIALFEQGDAYSNGNGDFVQLRQWVISQLMWNPALDQRKLEDEFLRGYYGAAAPHLRAYLDGIQQAWPAKDKLGCFNRRNDFLTLDVMNASTRHFRAAAEAVQGDPVLSARVRRERLALDHAWILRYKPLSLEGRERKVALEGPADLNAAIDEFIKMGRDLKIPYRGEGLSFEDYTKKLMERKV